MLLLVVRQLNRPEQEGGAQLGFLLFMAERRSVFLA